MNRDLALLGASFVLLTNPIAHVVRAADEVPYSALHPINVFVALSLLFLAVAWGLRRPGAWSVAPAWPMLVIAAFAALTAPWSVSPLRSFFWAAHLGFMCVVVSTLARHFSMALIREAALAAVAVLLVMSFAAIVLAPAYGTSDEALYRGAWRGVFAGKNHLGLVAALGVLLSFLTKPRWRFLVLAMSLVVLLQTKSGGGVLMVLSGTAVLLVLRAIAATPQRWRPAVVLGFSGGFLALVSFAFVFWSSLATKIGRDVSLSGRTVLWSHVLERIAQRPLVGHGLRAYFEGDRDHRELQAKMNNATAKGRTFAPPREEVIVPVAPSSKPVSVPAAEPQVRLLPEPKWKIHNAHNGLLAIAMDLGVPVTLFFLLFLAWRCAPSLMRAARGSAGLEDTAMLVILAALLAHNCVEVSVLRSWHPEALLFLLVLLSLFARPVPSET